MDGKNPNADAARYWLALACTNGVGASTAEQLFDVAGSPTALFEQSESDLVAAGIRPVLAKSLQNPDWHAVDCACGWLEAAPDRALLLLNERGYPFYLQQIPDPPLVLFVEGRVDSLNQPQLGMVGSRNPSPDGAGLAADFARGFSRAGVTITSGMALGIDASAHQGALNADGQTIAVAGCGPDRIYPKAHIRLAERIRANGALVSEFFPGTPPRADNFPRRNRIISGLSLGVIVVEAALRSGSLITARYAAEQGREVFAIPGSIHSPLARGCHRLIRQGAKLVESITDVLEELPPLATAPLATASSEADHNPLPEVNALSADSVQVLEQMGDAPLSVDQLVVRSGLTADTVSSILLLLELRGLVTSQPGGVYSRLRRDNT